MLNHSVKIAEINSNTDFNIKCEFDVLNGILNENDIQKDMLSLAVIGKSKAGKSYILNRICQMNEDYDYYGKQTIPQKFEEYASESMKNTKGIWFQPIADYKNQGKNMVFMDTEGVDNTNDVQVKVINLAVLVADIVV